MRITVEHNLREFNRVLQRYYELSGKSRQDVLYKQGGKLGYAMRNELRGIAPAKGQIREERLAALARGEGILISPQVRRAIFEKYNVRSEIASQNVVFGKRGRRSVLRKGGRRLNLQALMVQREINLRERARGFLSWTSKYPRVLKKPMKSFSRFGPTLSEVGFKANFTEGHFSWSGEKSILSGEAAAGLTRSKARAAISRALKATIDDIMIYVMDKLRKDKKKAGFKQSNSPF